MLLSPLMLCPAVLAIASGTSFRVVGKNLTVPTRWSVYAMRLLSSSDCDGATQITMPDSGGGTEYLSSGVFCEGSGLLSFACNSWQFDGPDVPLTSGQPQLPYEYLSWKGQGSPSPWIGVRFSSTTTVGCVQLFQRHSEAAGVIELQAQSYVDGPWSTVATAHGAVCPNITGNVDERDTCCQCMGAENPEGCPDEGWSCPAGGVTVISTAAPSPSQPPPPSPPRPPPSRPPPPRQPPPPSGLGCTSPDAVNFASDAVVDDGSCIFGGCTDSASIGFDARATYPDGSCPLVLVGCTDSQAANFRSLATEDDGSCRRVGCLDSTSPSYDASAVLPGLCSYDVVGCRNGAAINYHPGATHDAACLFAGCTHRSVWLHAWDDNFDPSANIEDGSCPPSFPGCMDTPTAPNYHMEYTEQLVGSCSSRGCTVSADPNYSADATFNDGSCADDDGAAGRRKRRQLQTAQLEGCMDPASETYNSTASSHAPDDCYYPILGCMDSAAFNFFPFAQADRSPSDCTYAVYGCTYSSGTLNFDSQATHLAGCVFERRGCTDVLAPNFMPWENVDDSSCELLGCADSFALNYNDRATVSAACEYANTGCMDSTARTYLPDVTLHNASLCTYDVLGCMLPLAANFASDATRDDGSCLMHGALASLPSLSPPSQPPLAPPAGSLLVADDLTSDGQKLSIGGSEASMEGWLLAVLVAGAVLVPCIMALVVVHRRRRTKIEDATFESWHVAWRAPFCCSQPRDRVLTSVAVTAEPVTRRKEEPMAVSATDVPQPDAAAGVVNESTPPQKRPVELNYEERVFCTNGGSDAGTQAAQVPPLGGSFAHTAEAESADEQEQIAQPARAVETPTTDTPRTPGTPSRSRTIQDGGSVSSSESLVSWNRPDLLTILTSAEGRAATALTSPSLAAATDEADHNLRI